MKRRCATWLALLLLPWPAWAAFIDLNDRIESIPPYISEVYRCGHWQEGEREGYFRVLYAEFYYGNSLLYVQWMEPGSPPVLLHTLSIPEFNANDHIELSFEKPQCVESAQGIRFFIEAQSDHDEALHRFDIQIFREPGRYRIREVTP